MTRISETIDTRRPGAATARFGALALPLGIAVTVGATAVHPHREDVMNDPVVFAEYASRGDWITVHFAQWAGALLLAAGLIALFSALRPGSLPARLGLAASGQFAAAITALQVIDGVALKWAVDAWAAAPPDAETPYFAAAQALRWSEYGFQSYSNILLGLAIGLAGLAILRGATYPRWLGYVALGSAAAWIAHGTTVAYIGLFDSAPRLVGMALLALFVAGLAPRLWRHGRDRTPAS